MPSPLSILRSLVLLQLLSRLLTFSLNQILLRLVSPASFAIANVQFELLGGTMLVLAREAVRGVVLRRKPEVDINHNDLSRKQRNLHRTPFLISSFIIPLIIPIYLSNISSNLTSHPNFHLAFSLHISSILIEAYSESAYLRALEHGEVKTRVKAEGLGVICKALTTVGWLLCVRKLYGESKVEEQALVAFGLGQLAWSICLVVVYAAAEMGRGEFGIGWWPFYEGVHVVKQPKTTNTIESHPSLLPPSSTTLITTLTLHSLIKHFLTEGDRLVVSWVSGLEDGAGYAVAGNYASLIARIIFQPVEESTRLFFSRSLIKMTTKEDGNMKEESPIQPTTPHHLSHPPPPPPPPRQIFILLIRTSILLLLLCPTFIPPILPYLLPIILPPKYLNTSAPSTLLAYLTIYIPILALNGILEAVFSVTASSGAVANQGGVMVLCSGAFGIALLGMSKGRENGFIRYTPESCLVAANSLQMVIRIGYAWAHARKVFAREGKVVRMFEVLPRWKTVGAVGAAGVGLKVFVERVNVGGFSAAVKVVTVGGMMAVGCLTVYYMEERRAWIGAGARKSLKVA